VVVQTAGSHAHVAPVLGYSQKVNNKRGFGEAREWEMHVLGELLGWRRGWLAGACGWNESESRAKGDQRSEQEQNRKNSANERRREQRSAVMLLLLRVLCVETRDESRTRRANRRSLWKRGRRGDPLLSLGALALLENGWRTSRAGHQQRGEHARQSKRLVRCLRGR
jgi:hypothetical protein